MSLEVGLRPGRDIFIESFWKQRIRLPDSQNEFKDEHINVSIMRTLFSAGERPGRLDDGHGPDAHHPQRPGLDRTVRRSHRDLSLSGLVLLRRPDQGPADIFRPGLLPARGSGEFRLYNQFSDGPLSLLIDTKGLDVTNYEALYQKIKEFAPTLAGVSISMIPDRFLQFHSLPQDNLIMATITESPKKNISPSYATHFLNFKGVVSTEYMTNYIESTATVALAKDPSRDHLLPFCPLTKSISLDYYKPKDQYFCSMKMDVSLRSGEKIIFQYSKDFPVYIPPTRWIISGRTDLLPRLLPGD